MARCPTCGKPLDPPPPPPEEALRLEAEIYELNSRIRLTYATPESPEWQSLMREHADLVQELPL